MTGNNGVPPRILVVEDTPEIAYLIRFILERQGFQVDQRDDGREALQALDQPAPDLVVSDIMLPYIDGIEFVQRIREREAWESVPVVMLTARSSENDIVRAFDAGADDYVVKPFQPDELVARLQRLLRRITA